MHAQPGEGGKGEERGTDMSGERPSYTSPRTRANWVWLYDSAGRSRNAQA